MQGSMRNMQSNFGRNAEWGIRLKGSMRSMQKLQAEQPMMRVCVAGSTEASQEASQTVGGAAQPPKMSLSARLGEVALFVSGRTAPVWWPAEVMIRWLVCYAADHSWV